MPPIGNGLPVPDEWLDARRDDMVIVDEQGVVHAAILCTDDKAGAAQVFGERIEAPFVCTLCDYFDAINAVLDNPMSFQYPKRRWPPDKETHGMETCLFCLGL